MGALALAEKTVVTIGSKLEEHKGAVTIGKMGARTAEAANDALAAGHEAQDVYHSVKKGLSGARDAAAVISTIPVIGEFLGTIPQGLITVAELATDVAGGQKASVIAKNLAANGAQLGADLIPGGGIAVLAGRTVLSSASDKIRGGVEDVPSTDRLQPGTTPVDPRLASANKAHTPSA